MRKLLMFFGFFILLVVVAGAVLLWALQDANRFKPELQALIAESTGMDIKFNGDLSWQLWPPVVLAGKDIAFSDDDTAYAVGSVGVKADVMALLRGGELVVQQLVAEDVELKDLKFGDITRLDRLSLDDFEAGKPSPLALRGALITAEGETAAVSLNGMLTFFPDEDRLSLANAKFDYDGIEGVLDAKVSNLSREPSIEYEPGKDDLLPLDSFRAMDWVADINIPEFSDPASPDLVLQNIAVHSENRSARSTTTVEVPQLLGGALKTKVAIDTRKRVPRWQVDTDASGLQAQELAKLIAPQLAWVAALLADGGFALRGNTPDELLGSINGSMKLSANAGTIDISKVKEVVLGIAKLAGAGERVQNWQDQLAYQNFNGDWQVNGKSHIMDFAFDNLAINVNGDYDPTSDAIDMRGSFQINEHATLNALDVNPDLYGLAIPMRCRGTAIEPQCGLDSEQAQAALAQLAANKARGKIDDKLNEALEDKVPEEYRETAREALKGLGDLFKKKD